MSSEYRFTWGPDGIGPVLPAGPWVWVHGGDLPVPVGLRVHRSADGRAVFTGLVIGNEFEPAEITSQTLREIRLSKILAALFEDFDPGNPETWTAATSALVVSEMNAELGHSAAHVPVRGPSDEALRSFARTYLTELARQPQRAMTAAAKAHDISRATANRWAALCRRYGYLPSGEERS